MKSVLFIYWYFNWIYSVEIVGGKLWVYWVIYEIRIICLKISDNFKNFCGMEY